MAGKTPHGKFQVLAPTACMARIFRQLPRYGKCNFCQIPEGKLVKGAGALANPGGKGGCQEGGKCCSAKAVRGGVRGMSTQPPDAEIEGRSQRSSS